jgi:hypothetical protein
MIPSASSSVHVLRPGWLSRCGPEWPGPLTQSPYPPGCLPRGQNAMRIGLTFHSGHGGVPCRCPSGQYRSADPLLSGPIHSPGWHRDAVPAAVRFIASATSSASRSDLGTRQPGQESNGDTSTHSHDSLSFASRGRDSAVLLSGSTVTRSLPGPLTSYRPVPWGLASLGAIPPSCHT